jgi:hypothetical protein
MMRFFAPVLIVAVVLYRVRGNGSAGGEWAENEADAVTVL